MTQTTAYDGGTLTTVIPKEVRYVEVANLGETGMGSATLDDEGGALTITGLKAWTVTQSSAPSGNQRVFTGTVADRRYSRGTFTKGASREIAVSLVDVNAALNFRIVTGDDGERPAETMGARLTWLLGSGYLDAIDSGYVIYPGTDMDENDYRGQTAGNVISDCAQLAGYNYFLFYDETEADVALWFDEPNTSSAYSTTARISNVAADVDNTTTFAPLQDAELVRDPQNVVSGVYVPYARGAVYRTNAATAAAFAERDQTAPNANVQTEVSATAIGDGILAEAADEEDTITCSIWVLPAYVNAIRAGQLMDVKFSHLPGYESFTAVRVKRRTVSQPQNTDARYQIDLELAGIGNPPSCDDAVDVNALHGTVTGAVAAESGSPTPTWAHATIPGWFGSPADDPVTAIPFVDVGNANDGDVDTSSLLAAQNIRYSGCVAAYWNSDLGDTYSVCSVKGTNAFSGTQLASRPPTTIDYSDDGETWTHASYSLTYTAPIAPQYWIATLSAPVAARYWRLRYLWCGTGGVAGLWIAPGWNNNGTRVWDWQILADPDPV